MISIIRNFAADRRGNVAMMFGLALMPILGATGAAVDYSRQSSARSAIAAAADAAALAGAAKIGTVKEREEAAKAMFSSNLQQRGYNYPVTVRYTNIRERNQNTGFRVETNSPVPNLFGKFIGSDTNDIGVVAVAKAGTEQVVEIAFVLDTTASMEGSRLDSLKTVTNQMLDDLTSRAQRQELLKVGVVPFAQYVNVGMSQRNAPWIDVAPDYQTPIGTSCSQTYDVVGTKNCRQVTYPAQPAVAPSTCMIDGVPRQCGGSSYRAARTETVCDNIYATTPRNVCTPTGGHWVRWNGCVGSRNYPLETQDGSYGTRIPGILGVTCAEPIRDLTSDIGSIRTVINGLTAQGNTYLPAGMIWGKRMLSPGEPLSASSSPDIRKIMVMVTDGKNTLSPTYPTHDGGDEHLANKLTRETCDNIAADRSNPIRVYTIAFEMNGLETKGILQSCAARTGGQFFDATDTAKLRAAFNDIVNAIYGVKLTQ